MLRPAARPSALALLLASTTLTLAPPVLAQPPEAAADAPTIAILTPAVPETIQIRSTSGLSALTFGLSTALTMQRSDRLTDRAAADAFNAGRRLSEHLLRALREAGHAAAAVPVMRDTRAGPRPIGREELPQALPPSVRVLLDVSITQAGFVRRFVRLEPYMVVSYRVLGPSGELEQLSRLVNFNAAAAELGRPRAFERLDPPPDALAPADGCRFLTSFSAARDAAKLWNCFDQGLAAVATRIAADPLWSASRAGRRLGIAPPPSGQPVRGIFRTRTPRAR